MKPNLPALILPFYFLAVSLGFAQQAPDFTCGFDDLRTPAQEKAIRSFEEQLRAHFSQKKGLNFAQKGFFSPPYIVPVVVHIIHDGGPENIPDTQILQAIEHLNEGFAAQGYFGQQGATVNTQIQFCMAKRDPDGNATNGITRTQSPLTNMISETQDIQTKDLNRWNPLDYVNIWVVKEITSLSSGSGVAGYAYFPNSHGSPQDGMICEAKTFGTSSGEDAVLIHEMGHYFGLYHTFEGGCQNNDCTVDGDRVCDTPPDNATHTACPFNSCSTDVASGSPFISDVDDFTGDFMDYSPFQCYNFFTSDQAVRMQAAVEMVRNSLLESKGCQSPCTQPIVAAFSAMPNPVIVGNPVTFTSNSSNASNFSWSENGLEFAQGQNASNVFSTTGFHTIVLTATNSDPNCVETSIVFVEVQCPIQAGFSASQLEAIEGSTLTFTNTSTGAAPLNYEWTINGQLVSSTTDLSYLFQNTGYYTVKLKAVGDFCQNETSVLIKIANPCGMFPEPVQISYTGQQKLFQLRDMVALPNGSIIQCGEHFQHAMVSKWDQAGNLIWHKEEPGDGTFTQIDPTPDGNFLLTGESNASNSGLFIAKMDGNGNFLWTKTITSTEVDFLSFRQFDVLAVNPDGTFGLLYRDDSVDGAYLSKFTADGDILWSKKILQLGQSGSLCIAKDGTGDFVFASYGPNLTPGEAFSVLFFSQTGTFKKKYKHGFPNVTLGWMHNFNLDVHDDGGYSIFYTDGDIPYSQNLRKHLIRCTANGTVKWAKRYTLLNGNQRTGGYIRQLPGEKGWLVVDSRIDASALSLGDFLERLDSNGQILWTRRLGDTPANDFWVMPPVYQSGGIRSLHCDFFNQDLHLTSIYDSNLPMTCVPVVADNQNIVLVQPSMAEGGILLISKDVTDVDVPLVFSNVPLTKTILCSAPLLCPEVCDNELDDDEDGYIDCFDTDCDCFTVDTACTVLPPTNVPLTAKIAWESAPDLLHNLSVPIVGNLNPQVDSMPEIIVFSNVKAIDSIELLIFKGDGSNRLNPVKFAPQKPNITEQTPPLLIDINKDGVPELLVPTWDGKISVYTNYQENQTPPFTFWFESTPGSTQWATMLNSADFDHDGIPEIFMGRKIYKFDFTNPMAPSLTHVLTGTGHAGGVSPWGTGFLDVSAAADILSKSDCNGDPDCEGLELAAGAHIYSIDLDPNDGDGLQIKIQRNLNQLAPGNVYTDGFTQIADINLDGTPDMVVNGSKNPGNNIVDGCYVWDKNGLITYFKAYPTTDWNSAGKLTIANVFDDRKAGFAQDFPEIIRKMGDSMRVVAFNLQAQTLNPAKPFWWEVLNDDDSNQTFFSAFDFNRDGLDDLVSKGDSFLRVYYGGNAPFPLGVNPVNRVWFQIPHIASTYFDGPIIADADNDGDAEILYSINSNHAFGTLRILESANLPWPEARPLWNQYSYFPAAINDDLSVPKIHQKHWLEMGGIGSGKRPFNTHLTQISSLNPFNSNRLKVPDADIAFDSTHCKTDSFEVYLSLCNQGAAPLPNGTPITFYLGDPTSTAAPILFTSQLIHATLEVGACAKIHLNIPASYNSVIFAVINDDGSLPRPFNLTTTFPATGQPECQYENNMISFSILNQTPTLDLGPDISLCKNSVVELSANPNFQKYRWQDGSTAPTFTAYTAGKFWVDAFDACGFRQTDTINILLNTVATLDLPDELAICEGEPVNLAASGFSKYTWSPADSVSCSNCSSVNLLAKASITVFLTATEGACFVTDSVHIQINSKPDLQLLAQNGDCDTPASITSTVLGEAPFSFMWSNMSTDSILSVSQPGTYTVEVTDKNGCQSSDSTSVSITNSLEITASINEPSCVGAQTGSIDLSVNAGLPPFQFLWSNNATTEDLTNAASGTYSVLTTDANGCTATFAETLTDPAALMMTLQKTDPKCAGEASGAINLTALGGTGNLTFSWSNNLSSEDLSDLPAGTYSILATDANGCTATLSETLIDPPALLLSLLKIEPNCAGETSGALDLTTSGGTGSVTFSWSNNSDTEDLSSLSSGTYSVIATDLNGCIATIFETLTDPPALVLSLQKTEPNCAGEATGALNLTAIGGSGNLTYSWSNNSSQEDPGNLAAGNYSVLTTDDNGCTAIISETLTDPPVLVLDLQKTEPKCAGEATGALDLTASGGTGNLTFSWSNNSSTEDLNNLPSGTYSVLTTDVNGCTALIFETLTEPSVLNLNLISSPLNCPGSQGMIDLTASGGTAPFTFLWESGETTEDINISQSGTYTVTVTDFNGCTISKNETILTHGAPPILSLTTDTLTCKKTTGVISAASNFSNTTFLWSGPNGFSSTNPTPTISTSGIYSVLATEPSGGCTTIETVFVAIDTTAPTVLVDTDFWEFPCDELSISISAAGSSSGTNYSIEWTASSGGSILSGETTLTPSIGSGGLYDLSITNLTTGCTSTEVIEVIALDKPVGVVSADSVRCFGEINGAIQVISSSGGTAPLTYSIDNQNFSAEPIFNNLAAGHYQVFIQDANGCKSVSEIEVAQPAIITVELTGDTLIVPGANATVLATVSPANLTQMQIDWSASGVELMENQLAQSVQLLQNTLFQIKIEDKNGCSAFDELFVRVGESHKIYVPNVFYPESSNGINQHFQIFTGLDVLEIRSLDIFDRWGEQVFSNQNFQPNDDTQGWDGTFRGKLVGYGVYVWVAKLVFMNGHVETFKGGVTVIR